MTNFRCFQTVWLTMVIFIDTWLTFRLVWFCYAGLVILSFMWTWSISFTNTSVADSEGRTWVTIMGDIVLGIFQSGLSLSAFIKLFDVPLVMSDYMSRLLHLMSYPKDDVLYQDKCILYCVSQNKNIYLSKKVLALWSLFYHII